MADTNKAAPNRPIKAYKNLEFLNSPEARTIRVQCELLEPELHFRRNNVNNTVVVFGSARTLPEDKAQKSLDEIENEISKATKPTSEQKEKLRIAKLRVKRSSFYADCMDFSTKLTAWSQEIKDPDKRFHIVSGGGPGIMEAANRGAFEAGGKSIGLGISLPFEQGINPYCTKDLGMEFHYFFVRKYWFLYFAKAIIVFPGGFGTMDEFFELLTLIQTKKVEKRVPIVLYGSEFWNNLINFDTFVEWGVISPEDVNLFKIVDSVDEAFEYIRSDLEQHCL